MDMTANATFILQDIEKLSDQPRSKGTAKLPKLLPEIEKLTQVVDQRWDELSPDMRKTLQYVVYSVISPPQGAGTQFQRLIMVFRGAMAMFNEKPELVDAYKTAVNRFLNAVTNAVEHENPCYDKTLDEVYKDLIDSSAAGAGQLTPVGDVRAWLGKLSDKALSEV